jgi:DNA-binding phage protein
MNQTGGNMKRHVFDTKLNVELHRYKVESGLSFYQIADKAEIHRNRLYKFTSGHGLLRGEEVHRLMDLMGVKLQFTNE